MDLKKLSSLLIFTGGLIELVIGILHFTWPFSFLELQIFQGVDKSISTLLLLAVLSVGLCLIVFACLSFYFSKQANIVTKNAWVFSITQSILWSIRLILEILLPVRISLYFIHSPSNVIVGGAIILILVYLLPVILLKKALNNKY
jgi:hypothetical protein